MIVIVHQTGDHGAAVQIGEACRRPGKLTDRSAGAHRQDCLAAHGNRLLDTEGPVHRYDLAVVENFIGDRRRPQLSEGCGSDPDSGNQHEESSVHGSPPG